MEATPHPDAGLIVADAEPLSDFGLPPDAGLTRAEGEAFAAKLVWDPRGQAGRASPRLHPRAPRAWREESELAGRLLLHDDVWLI